MHNRHRARPAVEGSVIRALQKDTAAGGFHSSGSLGQAHRFRRRNKLPWDTQKNLSDPSVMVSARYHRTAEES